MPLRCGMSPRWCAPKPEREAFLLYVANVMVHCCINLVGLVMVRRVCHVCDRCVLHLHRPVIFSCKRFAVPCCAALQPVDSCFATDNVLECQAFHHKLDAKHTA